MKSKDNSYVQALKMIIEVITILRDPDLFENYLKTTEIETINMVKEKRSELQSYQLFGLLTYLSFLDDYKELLENKIKELNDE